MKPEEQIHRIAVAFLRANGVRFFHAANENNAPVQYRAKLKALGVSAGVPDLVILHPVKAVLEIKSDRGVLSDPQREWLADFKAAGFSAVCTKGHIATANQLHEWGLITSEQLNTWEERYG